MKRKFIPTTLLMSFFLLAACAHEGNHPAHKMDERADRVNKENSADYQESREQAADTGNQSQHDSDD